MKTRNRPSISANLRNPIDMPSFANRSARYHGSILGEMCPGQELRNPEGVDAEGEGGAGEEAEEGHTGQGM